MTDEIINGVRVSGYTKKEDIEVLSVTGRPEIIGTKVTMPTGASIFLRADKAVVA